VPSNFDHNPSAVIEDGSPAPMQRLTRERRLRHRTDYLKIQKQAVRVVSPHFVFLLAPRIPAAPSRLGVTATRKVGNSVVRNRAKRLVREVYRRSPGFVPEGVDLVVVVRSALTNMRMQQVLEEWRGVARLVWRRSIGLVNSSQRVELST
jgi:ribonuclease P protein component